MLLKSLPRLDVLKSIHIGVENTKIVEDLVNTKFSTWWPLFESKYSNGRDLTESGG